jgi:uncharacterized coiled-coil DUF342 family protein
MKNKEKIIMTKKAIVGLSLTQKFKKMYLSEIVPLLKQKIELYAKRDELYANIDELDAKRSELDAKINELYAKLNELYAKRSELYVNINELDVKIFWNFADFEKENNCIIEWKNLDYDFKLENLEVKSNKEIEEAEKIKKAEVPQEIEKDGHIYTLKN